MKIMIGTTNRIKLMAIEEVLLSIKAKNKIEFTTLSASIESQVPDTPYEDETIKGAKNRANLLFENYSNDADIFVGLESGLIKRYDNIYEECWCVIKDKNGDEFYGYSSGFMLPTKVTEQMKTGKTHIQVLKDISRELNLDNRDTWSIYSKGVFWETVVHLRTYHSDSYKRVDAKMARMHKL